MAVATYRECEVEEEGGDTIFFFLCGCFSLILDGERLSAASRCDCLFFFFFFFSPFFFFVITSKSPIDKIMLRIAGNGKGGGKKKKMMGSSI